MMATESIPDARHEAVLHFHRALLAIEAGDAHAAENYAQTAIAYLHDMPRRPEPSLNGLQVTA